MCKFIDQRINNTFEGSKVPAHFIEWCSNQDFLDGLQVYQYGREFAKDNSGVIYNRYELEYIRFGMEISKRSFDAIIRKLQKELWIIKDAQGNYKFNSLDRILQAIEQRAKADGVVKFEKMDTHSEELRLKDLYCTRLEFKAVCMEIVQAKLINSLYWNSSEERKSQDLEMISSTHEVHCYRRDKSACELSYGLIAEVMGISKGYAYALRKVHEATGKTLSARYKRYCPYIDSLNIKTSKRLAGYISAAKEAGEDWMFSMFQFSRNEPLNMENRAPAWRWRKRETDYVATGVSLTRRRRYGKRKRLKLYDLIDRMPNTKSASNIINHIIENGNMTFCHSIN